MSTAKKKRDKGREEKSKEDPEMVMKRDDHYEAVIELFFPYLLDKLRASHLLCLIHLDEVREVSHKIHRLENEGRYEEAARQLLEAIKKSSQPGRWQMFVDAVHEDGAVSLVEFLVEGKVGDEWWQDDLAHRKMIELFAPQIHNVNLDIILDELFQVSLIRREDLELLRAMVRRGEVKGAVGRVLVLIQRSGVEAWFRTFLTILIDCDYHELVKEISPYMYKKICEERGTADTPEAASLSLTPDSPGMSSTQQSGGGSWATNWSKQPAASKPQTVPSSTRPPRPAGEPGRALHTASSQEQPTCSCACCGRVVTELAAIRQENTQVRQEMTQVVASLKAEQEQTAALRAEMADLKKILLKLGNRH